MDKKPVGICHRCTKEFPLTDKHIKFMMDNLCVFPSWVCDECAKQCISCEGTGYWPGGERGEDTEICGVCEGTGVDPEWEES